MRVGPHTSGVRASCFTAPAGAVEEHASLLLAGTEVVGFSYVVSSPACGAAPASASISASLPTERLDVVAQAVKTGPVLYQAGNEMDSYGGWP